MMKILSVLLVSLMVLSAAAVYDMKYEAEAGAERVAQLERDVRAEQEKISRLKAEWSVFTQPQRLQDLTQRNAALLKLQPMTANQIAQLTDIPLRAPPPAPPVSADPIGDLVSKLPGMGNP